MHKNNIKIRWISKMFSSYSHFSLAQFDWKYVFLFQFPVIVFIQMFPKCNRNGLKVRTKQKSKTDSIFFVHFQCAIQYNVHLPFGYSTCISWYFPQFKVENQARLYAFVPNCSVYWNVTRANRTSRTNKICLPSNSLLPSITPILCIPFRYLSVCFVISIE